MNWTAQLQGHPEDYTPIIQSITPSDGDVLQIIYEKLSDHAINNGFSLLEYARQGVCINIGEALDIASLSTLKAVGLIITDYSHVGLTLLGIFFLQCVKPPIS